MDGAIVGRDAVLELAWRALDGAGPVIVEGPAGIGKTAVLRALTSRAERHDWSVLACAPTEAEAALPFAALADVLRPLAAAVADLPGPQRLAAEVVLLCAEAVEPVDERAVGAATRTLLAAVVGAGRRLLVAVDDAHWLDRPSERALRFALRRVGPLPVLVTCRPERPVPLELARRASGPAPTRIGLAPLGPGALHHVLRARLGRTLSRPLLARIAREAGGNPLLAIELARAVLRLPRLPLPTDDLPVAASMPQLVLDAVASLPAASRDGIRLAALLAVPRLRELAAAGVSASVLEPAEEAGLIEVTAEAVEFTHPVYASAIRAAIPAGVRRRLHRILAGAVADPDERARHLASSTVEPDGVVAGTLAAAAARHRARGAPELAAGLYARAAELTPRDAPEDAGRRRLAAARCWYDSGDYRAAAEIADALAAQSHGDLRAEALLHRAVVAWSADDVGMAAPAALAEQALAGCADPRLAGRIHAHLGAFQDRPDLARRHAQAAVDLLAGSDADRELLSAALLLLLFNEVRAGLPARTELLDRALPLEGDHPSWLAGSVPAIWWKGLDEHDRARERLARTLERAVSRGDEPSQHETLTHLGETELLAGRWDAAARHITAARELGEQLGTGLIAETWLGGLLDAHQGRLAEAGRTAAAGLRLADELDDVWCRRIHLLLAGFVALSAGRMADAAAAFTALAAAVDEMGLVEPLPLRFEPDWIEACVGAGDLDTAGAALDRLAARHRRLPRPWTTLGLARSRVLLDAARGVDVSDALEVLARARAALPADVLPLDQARCLLVAGVAHRRARRKRQARETLTAAAERFTALGARAFAERTYGELARVGGRPPGPSHLTATEERVARLAAAGRTNRVIADELFLSPKTVEANLARVYRKLGISSRAQLGAAMARRPDGDA